MQTYPPWRSSRCNFPTVCLTVEICASARAWWLVKLALKSAQTSGAASAAGHAARGYAQIPSMFGNSFAHESTRVYPSSFWLLSSVEALSRKVRFGAVLAAPSTRSAGANEASNKTLCSSTNYSASVVFLCSRATACRSSNTMASIRLLPSDGTR